jgi:hypothetical protein
VAGSNWAATRPEPEWRRRRRRRIRVALIALLAAAVVTGAALALDHLLSATAEEQVAERFGMAWAAHDLEAMYALLDAPSREETAFERFQRAYAEAEATATATGIEPGDASSEDGVVVLPVTVSTTVWGEVAGDIRLPIAGDRVEWGPEMTFPGLRPDEELDRRTREPRRAAILSADGTVLAEGDAGDRTSELGLDASTVAGTIGPPATEEEADELYARGFDRNSQLGLTGLELAFEERIAGTPGGVLRAGDRELAVGEPRPAVAVTTTIDPDLQATAATAIDGLGGIAALDAQTAEVRALTGLALTGAQPPGSTFKIVTTVAALEGGVVEPSTEFPVETGATIEGRTISNSGDAPCGGTFTESFAESCNSVFAPLGVEVGSERLVETAERFGVNGDPAIPGAEGSTLPPADEIGSDLDLGATAIGQGRLLLTPLRLAAISQAIAADGVLTEPSLTLGATSERRRVTSPSVADTVEELMVGVVAGGTGDAAAVSGVDVAGKTGTAELGEGITEHAWFTAFAPAGRRPELAIAVFVANGGAGGEVAAPIGGDLLRAGLE